MRVVAVRYEAANVVSLELVDPEYRDLPRFEAGSHVDLTLPSGLVRSYSLANSPSERDRYVIGVYRAPSSRGGSSWIHDGLRPGALLEVSKPLNNFALEESAETSIMIAGGIGVTPMLAMAQRLQEIGKPWTLYYAVRDRSLLAFRRQLESLSAGPNNLVTLHVDAENGNTVLDLATIIAAAPGDAHLYCCGPAPMLAAFKDATSDRDPKTVHIEYFSGDVEVDTSGGYEVVLNRTDLTLLVRPGRTILETMQAAGVDVPHSCKEGICGTCETAVLEGVPDHRDLVLTEAEKATNDVMFVCCSGSKSPRLVLDA